MTGTATMSATQEGRDPSPSPGVKPASSGSSDEVEPWDEPPSTPNKREAQPSTNPLEDMMKSALNFVGAGGGEDEGLEDGDLPTLSLKKEQVSGQYVSGERSTRPLNPPSTKGMETETKDNDPPMRRSRAPTPRTAKQAAAQRQFWSQLNPPSPFESDVSRDQSDQNGDADDGPDDEMAAARRESRARELDNVPKQEDETIEGDESYRGNVNKVNSYEDGGGTCIEYTLASIGDICGTGQQIKDDGRQTNIREVRELREDMVVDDAEEHTAIEVEYVDPGPIPRRTRSPPPAAAPVAAAGAAALAKKKQEEKSAMSKPTSPTPDKELPTSRALDGESVELKESEATAWSSSRKNAVLAAMARRAKEDFQKHEDQKSQQGSASLTPKEAESPVGDQDNTTDIYNSFSPSEKRKFLKLINLGLTPTESTSRVVEERQNKESRKTPGSASKKRFSFWKKSAKVDAARSPASPRSPAVVTDTASVSSTAAVGEAEDSAIQQGVAEAAMAAPDSPPATSRSDAYSAPAKESSAIPATESSAIPATAAEEQNPDDEDRMEEGMGSGSLTSPETAETEESEREERQEREGDPGVTAGVIAAGAAAAGVGIVAARQAAVTARESTDTTPTATYEEDDIESSEEEEDSVRGQFPRSGINYYDGVRKELPEEEDSEEEFGEEIHSPSGKAPSKGSRLSSLTLSPRSQGFNSLHESERSIFDKDAEAVSKSVSPVARSLSPLGRQSKPSSSDQSGPLSPGGSTSARRRYLGIPILAGKDKGFTPLEEEDEDSKDTPEGSAKLPDGVQSAVAAAAVATAVTAAKSQGEEPPLPSMEDPFFGIDPEEAKLSGDKVEEKKAVIQEKSRNNISDVDTSLDSYLDSATVQSYASSQQDQHSLVNGSVVSGRSAYTAGTGMTGMTGHTQSSRKRRPGAAKERIAKAKRAEKGDRTKKGWHESIRAAAETNNRVWDPQHGWVDYKDPSEDVQDTSEDRIQISLDGVAVRSPRADDNAGQSQQDGASHSPTVPVPFPPGWEKERNEMVSPRQTVESFSQQARASATPPLTPRSVADSDQSQKSPVMQSSYQDGSPHPRSVVSDNDSPKPRGWEESMREASAGVSKDGRRWDPERGWIGLDKSVVESSPLSPRNAQEAEDNSVPSSDEIDGSEERKASPNAIFEALTKAPSETKIRDAREFAESESLSTASRSRETKMDNFIEKSSKPDTTANRSERSTEGSDQAVVAGVGEKYVQLGDNGAVKSVRRDSRTKKHSDKEDKLPFHPSLRKATSPRALTPGDLSDDDKAPLLTKGSTDSTEERAPAVKVVKEKVDEDDFSLFTGDGGASLGTGTGNGTPSRRRGKGPVDVDEVDDLDTETESEDGDENAWEPDSYMKGNVSPGMFVKPRSERSADPNFVSPTKTPPKLQKSSRDTSPIRSVGGGNEVASPREVVSPDMSPRVTVSSPDASPATEQRNHSIEQTVSTGDDSVGSVKQLAQKWEVRAKHGTQIMHDQSGDSFEYDERQVTALGDFGHGGHEQVDWPGQYEKQTDPAGTQEWKSFLGKKVQAETVAAATLEETKRRDGSLGASKSGIPRAPGPSKRVPVGAERGVNDEQGDSSFSFGDGPSDGDASPAMSAGSAAARRRERALQQSSPGGFSDVSPIPAEDEYGEARMERVSDTGTAVEQSSFMKRLSACAAPLSRAFTQNTSGECVPNSHLEFMRTNPAGQGSPSKTASGRFVPAALCGRQDIINENEDSEDGSSKRSLNEEQEEQVSPPTSPTSQILREVKERSSSRGRSRQLTPRSDPVSDMRSSSSVTSEDFGARTSYLEAIALRSAVSSTSSKKKRSRRRSQDSQSTVSDTSESKLSHSERWQAFLERKASQTASPPGSRAQSSTDISRAAEKYASEKVEEMMEVMASRSKSTPKSWRADEENAMDTSYGDSSSASPLSPYRLAGEGELSSKKSKKKKSESAKAAEELAAARVEAMMAQMTSSNLDEGEI